MNERVRELEEVLGVEINDDFFLRDDFGRNAWESSEGWKNASHAHTNDSCLEETVERANGSENAGGESSGSETMQNAVARVNKTPSARSTASAANNTRLLPRQ